MARARGSIAGLWNGVRMRTVPALADPDAPPVQVTLPAAWDEAAANAVAVLAEGRPASLAALAERFLAPLAGAGGPELACLAHDLLLRRRAAPDAACWQRGASPDDATYRLNLAAFADGAGALDEAALAEAASGMAAILAAMTTSAGVRRVALTGLDGLLAGCGLAYGAAPARALAAGAVRRIRARLGASVRLVAGAPDPVDALLGVEASGIAAAFAPVTAEGALSNASRALLAARGISAEAALARALCGETPLPVADPEAVAAMRAELATLLDDMPAARAAPPPPPTPSQALPSRRVLPRRRGGLAQRATIGGQKIYVTTGEFADGMPGEVSISLPQAAPTTRALVEALGHVIGIGLQHGASLAEFIEALRGTRFGPAGAVEGDPAVPLATSPLDYVARTLAASYLPELPLAPPETELDAPAPLLPLALPFDPHAGASAGAQPGPARRRGLRVVK